MGDVEGRMWTEILKDFGGAFVLAWLLLPITSTTLSVPFDIIFRLYPLKDYTAVRRHMKLLSLLLAVCFGLLAHGLWDWYAVQFTEPLNPPMDLNLSNL